MNCTTMTKSPARPALLRHLVTCLPGLCVLGWGPSAHAQLSTVTPVTALSSSDPSTGGNQAETNCIVNVSNGVATEIVAFNDVEPSSPIVFTDTNRTVFSGFSGQGWAYRARTSANSNPPWIRSQLQPFAGWDVLWGDPSLANNPGLPNYAFMGTLAIPHDKFVFVSTQDGTPNSLQGAFTDALSPLGGACIARTTNGGSAFFIIGCLRDTTDLGNEGDSFGHFYDGTSMAVTANGAGGFSAFAAFIDTKRNREAVWTMPDVTSNSPNPFQFDGTIMGNLGALPLDSLGPIDTHVRLRASGSDLWKMSENAGNLKVNVRNRNANAVSLAFDDALGAPADFGADAKGTEITLRTGPPFAFDIGVNEQNVPEMRFVYVAQDAVTRQYRLQGGYCPVSDLTKCTTVAQWTTQPQSETMAIFPAIKFAQDLIANKPVWKVTFQGRTPANRTKLAVFSADLVRPDLVPQSASFSTAGLVVTQVTQYQTPCPDIRTADDLGNNLGPGYWGDYDDMTFEPVTNAFVRPFTDSTLGCDSRQRFTSHNVHVSAVEIAASQPQYVAVSAGLAFSCGLHGGDSISCWGWNRMGQLGDGMSGNGTADVFSDVAVGVIPQWSVGLSVTQLSSGDFHSCVVLSNGSAWCWGQNDAGQLGNNMPSLALSPVPVPVAVPAGLTVKSIATGGHHTCLLTSDTSVWCFGDNVGGQVGTNSGTFVYTPTQVLESNGSPITGVGGISAGESHTCAVFTSDGHVECWGFNSESVLGNGGGCGGGPLDSMSTQPLPVLTANGSHLTGASAVRASSSFSCALLTNGGVTCWGAVPWGTPCSPVPVQVQLPGPATSMAAGISQTACAIVGGRAYCWGLDDVGEVGDGQQSDNSNGIVTNPVPVQNLGNASMITVASEHTCAVATTGPVACWGENSFGGLGNGETNTVFVPGFL